MLLSIAKCSGIAPPRRRHLLNSSPYSSINEGRRRHRGWLRREDSNLCISESEFAQTLSSGREKSNMRISIEGCRAAPHCQRKCQAMTDTGRSDSKCRGSNPAASRSQSVSNAY
jgi:hypothetical protein